MTKSQSIVVASYYYPAFCQSSNCEGKKNVNVLEEVLTNLDSFEVLRQVNFVLFFC
jgi:hypothetical protein